MVITRKISLIPIGTKEEKIEIIHQLYTWRSLVRKAANAVVTHKFVQQNIADFEYLKEASLEDYINGDNRLYAKDVIKDGPGLSEQNVTYRVISTMLKGKMPSDIFTSLNQSVAQSFKKRYADFAKGKASIPSFTNIPIPCSAKSLVFTPVKKTIEDSEGKTKVIDTYNLNFFHLPFELHFGKDNSGNRTMLKRALSGEYKLCGSSVEIIDADKDKGKKMRINLLLTLDVPNKELKAVKGRTMYASLDVLSPILCSTDRKTVEKSLGVSERVNGLFKIGNKEEFLHRRVEIQAGLQACQANIKYAKGGHGRKKKAKAMERYHDLEKNYIDYKTHVYSRELVNLAKRCLCDTILLIKQNEKEKDAKKTEILLRNWSYFSLKTKITYKAKMLGIKVIVEGEHKKENSE